MPHRLFATLRRWAPWGVAAVCSAWAATGCAHRVSRGPGRVEAATSRAAIEPVSHAGDGVQPGRVVEVGPAGLNLPVPTRPLAPEERRFLVTAAKALRLVYAEDVDDASAMEALLHRLHGGQNGIDADMAQAFERCLQEGIARANRLQACAPGIRALEAAYRNVYIDEGTRALRRLDAVSCQLAVQLLDALARAEPSYVLTIEPMGPTPIAALLAPCRL